MIHVHLWIKEISKKKRILCLRMYSTTSGYVRSKKKIMDKLPKSDQENVTTLYDNAVSIHKKKNGDSLFFIY